MQAYHLAQINVGRIQGATIDDPVMAEFVANLPQINALAEESEGFVWRLTDESDNATSFLPYHDPQILLNISVWESVEALQHYVYKTLHAQFMRRRREWFQSYGKPHTTMWWVPAGHTPSIAEAIERLEHYQANGPTAYAFDFRKPFPMPVEN